jgi:DNA polymerase-3 subunit epsilon
MYAILDIETTGGQFNEEGITEIAIYKYDGHEIIDQFISLINPEIPIQPFVVKLTGINNEMLKGAPKFFEVAKRIIEITTDTIIVAHNASFDYRILQTEFRRLGYDFNQKTLCTVALSQKLLPEQPSHSLGKLVRALGIPITDRHRASGDAMATVKLFKLLLDKDLEKVILKELVKTDSQKGIAPRLIDIINGLPSKTGIYYFHRQDGSILLIGKSKNIKKRVNQHFTSTTKKSKKIQNEVVTVTYQETGSELIAILKEAEEIAINRPVYNRTFRKKIFHWAIYSEKDSNGYLLLKLSKADGRKKEITAFATMAEGKNALNRYTSHYKLCQKLTGISELKTHCFQYTINQCDGACIGEISPTEYNKRVQDFIEKTLFDNKTMVIKDQGRTTHEHSAILIEEGVYKGYAFYDLNYQITNIEILRNILIPMHNNRETRTYIQDYVRKNRRLKIIYY